MRRSFSLLSIFLLLALPGFASAQTAAPTTAAVAAASGQVGEDYRLGVADKIRIMVFGEPTLTGEFSVNANGALSYPLIGDVAAKDRTAGQVRDELERRLSDGFLRNPRISIDVLAFRPFFILGEVNKPGEYPYSSGLTVMNAVATAEGFTYRANRKKVFLKRAGEANENQVPLTSSLNVQPGDTIRIGERYF